MTVQIRKKSHSVGRMWEKCKEKVRSEMGLARWKDYNRDGGRQVHPSKKE